MSCEAAQISRETYYRWYKIDSEFAERVEDIREQMKDMAETRLQNWMSKEKTHPQQAMTALFFYMNNQMRDRGYGQRIAIESGKERDEALQNKSVSELAAEMSLLLKEANIDVDADTQ